MIKKIHILNIPFSQQINFTNIQIMIFFNLIILMI